MCFCEPDVVNAMIHVEARRHYPGIRFHGPTLTGVAGQFGITNSIQLRTMGAGELRALADAVLSALPAASRQTHRPSAA